MSDEVSKTTNAITSYDGIFKGMYNDGLKAKFLQGRKLLAEGRWAEGKAAFEGALDEADDYPNDKKTLGIIVKEIHRVEENRIDRSVKPAAFVDWSRVAERSLEREVESMFGLPQGIYFLDIGRPGKPGYVRLVGRKLLSDLWIAFKIPELFCSLVTADMILGMFVDQRLSDSAVTLFYNPLLPAEKLSILDDIKAAGGEEIEIIHPFPLMRESTRQEWGSPPEGWVVDDAFDVMLGCGEERIRAYSIQFLKDSGLMKPVLYDPACSTGVFLSTLQKAFPGSYTIGQDLSQQMANFAKERVDEAHCANALDPKIKLGTADVCYVRFLNSEVITTSDAEMLLSALLPTVKVGGYIITFGHTPVLLSSSNFRRLQGFILHRCVGTAVDGNGIFQYYIIQRTH